MALAARPTAAGYDAAGMRTGIGALGWALGLATACTAVAPTGWAQPAPAPAPSTTCPRCLPPASAIETVARGVVAGLGKVPGGLVVGSAPLVGPSEGSDVATDGEGLRAQILRLVVGKLGTEARAAEAADAGALLAAAGDAPGYVWLMPTVSGGRLIVGADAYAVPSTVWARARQAAPRPLRHAQAQAPIDAEVRAHLAAVAFGAKAEVTTFADADPEIQALACGDLDGDGDNDVVTVTRARVLRLGLDRAAGKVVREQEAKWEDLAPIAPVPLRQPLAFATIVEGPTASHARGHVDLTLTDRLGSLRLGPDFEILATMKGKAVPHADRTACTWVLALLLGEKVQTCHDGDGAPLVPELGRRSDAMASTFLVGRDGKGEAVVALRDAGTLVLRSADAERRLLRVGAQLAVADLDQDGAVEIATTVDTLGAKFDALDVRTVGADGKLTKRYRLRVPTGVEALAACPPDGRGAGAILVATDATIWEVR